MSLHLKGLRRSTQTHSEVIMYEVQQDMTQGSRRYAGIGLSVCSTIVRAHGGTITAENRKNGGALFRFTIGKEEISHDQ